MSEPWPNVVQAIAAVGGLVVAIIGFWALIAQLRQVHRSLESEAHSKLYSEDFAWCDNLLQNPELRPYFRERKPIDQNDPLFGQADELAGLLCVHFEHILLQLENLPPHIGPRWLDYIRGVIAQSPITQSHLASNPSWYSPMLLSVAGQPSQH
jgi:hypothetical protein